MTYDEAVAQWKTENPPPISVVEGDEVRELTPEEYEALAQQQGYIVMEETNRREAEEANKQEGQAIKEQAQWLEDTAVNLRDTSKTMTSQQIRNVVAQGFDILAHVIRYLHKQRNPEEQDDG